MYKLKDTFVLTLLIFCSFLSVAHTTLNKLFAVFFIYIMLVIMADSCWHLQQCIS